MPLLKQYGCKGTFFVTTWFTGQGDYMSWQNLRDLVDSGMEVGAHTISHVDLAQVSPATRAKELEEPKRVLEGNLGVAVRALSYQGGAYNQEAISAARKAGYAVAVTTRPGALHELGKTMALPRVRTSGFDTAAAFAWKIEQFFPAKGNETL